MLLHSYFLQNNKILHNESPRHGTRTAVRGTAVRNQIRTAVRRFVHLSLIDAQHFVHLSMIDAQIIIQSGFAPKQL